jgi:Pentapeptide repeats (8 copies)
MFAVTETAGFSVDERCFEFGDSFIIVLDTQAFVDRLSAAAKAVETGTQVTRIGLTFLGTAAFCLLSLLSPDSALLGGSEKINVPLAGPVSFFGFMLLGPTVLIVLGVYLQIYVEHGDRLDRLARSVSVTRAPTLVPLRKPLIRVLSGLTFYLLLPVAMMLFAWKAAVFPAWGSGLLCVATGVVVSHVMLPFSRFSSIKGVAEHKRGDNCRRDNCRRGSTWFRASASSIRFVSCKPVRSVARRTGSPQGYLDHANLLGATLFEADLSGADLSGANLSGPTCSAPT